MQNYVISLTTQIKRREHVQKQFSQQGIPFKFFDAVTPDLVPNLVKKFGLDIENSHLTGGELGCTLSHIMLWQKMVDESIPYMAIFEDDIYLSKDSDLLLKDDDWIPDNMGLIKLEKCSIHLGKSRYSIKEKYQIGKFQFVKVYCSAYGAGGYLISLSYARFLLKWITSFHPIIPVDIILFDNLLNLKKYQVWQVFPAVCMQEVCLYPNNIQLVSSLNDGRKEVYKKLKAQVPFYKKVIRGLIRPFWQLYIKLKRIPFRRRLDFFPYDEN